MEFIWNILYTFIKQSYIILIQLIRKEMYNVTKQTATFLKIQ